MSSYNKVIMMGNLTRDPEFKQLPSGQAVCRMGIATNRQFKSKNSAEPVQEVCFIDVDVWGAQAESCNKFLEKGSPILLEGRLKLDSWQDSEGQKRSKHSVVADRITFVRGGSSDEAQGSTARSGATAPGGSGQKMASRGAASAKLGELNVKDQEPFEDDLPF